MSGCPCDVIGRADPSCAMHGARPRRGEKQVFDSVTNTPRKEKEHT